MSIQRVIKPNLYAVGAIDWDRRLFDELIPLPDGTTYNAYVIKGSQKTVLVDSVDAAMPEVLLANLNLLGLKTIDFVISHHAEQDHSGAIPQVLERYPEAKVLATPKCKAMLMDVLAISDDKFQTVADGETLSLGDKTLQFIHTPWVHWPETMVTYLQEDHILFSCDFFGSHIAASDLFVTDEAVVYEAAKRYYAEIMMPFRAIIRKNLEKLKGLEIAMIAPSHGAIYQRPALILDAYRDWISDTVKNEVVIPYVSMHGSTRRMVAHFVEALIQHGVTVKQFNLVNADIGKLAIALVDAATIVIGSPTVLVGPHPNVAYAAVLANAIRPKAKFASIIGSYGWSTKVVETLAGMLPNLKVEILDPVVVQGFPKAQDLAALDGLADKIAAKHRELKLL